MGVIYSKKRLVAQQSGNKNLKYMDPLAPGTVLTIEDVVHDSYDTEDGPVMNDTLMCSTQDGVRVKFPVKEFNKIALTGDAFEGESGNDEIHLPDAITIIKSEARTMKPRGFDEEITLYPTFAYNDGQKFVESKNAMKWEDMLKSGLRSDNTFSPIQNYTAEVVS